jgi:DNA repair exonuclease SbcCD ATPase subunit
MTRNTSFVARRETATAPDTPSLHGASRSPTKSTRMAPPPSPSLVRAIAEVEQKLKDAEDKFKEMEEKYKEKEKKHKEKEKKFKQELQQAERLVVKKQKKIKRLEDFLDELGRPYRVKG